MTTSLRALRVIHFWVETSRVCFPDHFAPSKGRFFWLALNRLGRAGVGAIVDRLRGDTAIPRATAAAMIARAYGVPLFVKELTKAVL